MIFIVFIGIICLHTSKNLNSLSYGQVNKKFYREVLCIIWNSFFQYFTTRIFYFIDLFYFFTDPTPSWRESIRRQMEEELGTAIAPLEKRNPQVALVVCNSFSLTFEPVF
jgi:hypothetical protein